MKNEYFRRVILSGNPVQKELYNLSVDPGETNNLYEQHPILIEKLEDYIFVGQSLFLLITPFCDDGENIQFPFNLD
jgi:hypothetical protein